MAHDLWLYLALVLTEADGAPQGLKIENNKNMEDFKLNDGGRTQAGYKGAASDCFTRSAAIVTGLPYRQVYDEVNRLGKQEHVTKRKAKRSNARTGVYRVTEEHFMAAQGFVRVPCMAIGKGTTVTLEPSQLPNTGPIMVSVSRHYTAIVDGVLQDTYDPRRYNGTDSGRCTRTVYAYWYHPDLTKDPVFPLGR